MSITNSVPRSLIVALVLLVVGVVIFVFLSLMFMCSDGSGIIGSFLVTYSVVCFFIMSAAISKDIRDKKFGKNTDDDFRTNQLSVKDNQELNNKQKALLQTINELLALGKTDNQISEILEEEGWTEDDLGELYELIG